MAFALPPAKAADTDAVLLMLDMIRDFGDFEDRLVRERRQALFAQHIVMPGRRGGGLLLATAALPYRRKETAFRFIDEALRDLDSLYWLTEDNLASARRKRLLGRVGAPVPFRRNGRRHRRGALVAWRWTPGPRHQDAGSRR